MSILILSGTALAFSGFAATSITMDRHYADIHGRGAEPSPATRLRLRTLGWIGLALSFMACIGASGAFFATQLVPISVLKLERCRSLVCVLSPAGACTRNRMAS